MVTNPILWVLWPRWYEVLHVHFLKSISELKDRGSIHVHRISAKAAV